MSKYGSSSFSVLLADGYNLLGAKVKNVTYEREALMELTHGLGDGFEASTPTGMQRANLTQDGAFFDDTTNSMHDAMKRSQQTSRILCMAAAGNVIGRFFWGIQGVYAMAYGVLGAVGALTKANAKYTVSGQLDEGKILQEWATRTDDWNTALEGNSVDNGASSANGGVGYLQVSGFSGPNALTVKIRHAADGGGSGATWVDLVTFVAVSGAQTAQRIAAVGTVNRYLSVIASGFGNVSPSASVSASVSPSVSASASASPSRSPSSSISPSMSTSLSPSASISPSASTSISPSASTSISPSSSISPSTSSSPSASVSPSAGAGPASSITLFVGFARS